MKAECKSTAEEIVFIPGVGRCRMVYSYEALQDMHACNSNIKRYLKEIGEPTEEEVAVWQEILDNFGGYGMIRTEEPTEEEIEGWKSAYEVIKDYDISEIKERYQVEIITDFEPYEDYDWRFDC